MVSGLSHSNCFLKKILPYRTKTIDKFCTASQKLDAVFLIGWHPEHISCLQFLFLFSLAKEEDLALCNIRHLLMNMILQRLRLGSGTVRKIDDYHHEIVRVNQSP
jgi:hypothetical protein